MGFVCVVILIILQVCVVLRRANFHRSPLTVIADTQVAFRQQDPLVGACFVVHRNLFASWMIVCHHISRFALTARNGLVVLFAAVFAFRNIKNGHNSLSIVGPIPSGFPDVHASSITGSRFTVRIFVPTLD